MSITAVSYLLENKYDDAIKYFKLAEEENPKDAIVLNNLAQAYIRKGDKLNAKKYCELVIKYGDSEEKSRAKEELSKLGN